MDRKASYLYDDYDGLTPPIVGVPDELCAESSRDVAGLKTEETPRDIRKISFARKCLAFFNTDIGYSPYGDYPITSRGSQEPSLWK